MNDTQIKIMKDIAYFLFTAKISRNFLHEFLVKSFEAKKHINELIGANEDNEYRVHVPLNEEYTNRLFLKFANVVAEWLNNAIKNEANVKGESLEELPLFEVKNAKILLHRNNEHKLTRKITRRFFIDNKENTIVLEMVKMSSVLTPAGITNPRIQDVYDYSEDLERKFPIWYGDQLNGNKRVLVLSTNPYDILRASSNTSFSSCYRVDGEYWNGCITSALSPNTAILSVEDAKNPGYKIGRSWVYWKEDLIVVGREYGSIYNDHVSSVVKFLASKMGWDHFDFMPGYKINTTVETLGPAYLDKGYGYCYGNKWDGAKITLPPSMCLYCGGTNKKNSSLGVCDTCRNSVTRDMMIE